MALLATAHRFIETAPREAISDALGLIGLIGLCGLVFLGFTLPGLL